MNLARIKTGDIVQINKKGRIFEAMVDEIEPHGVKITPLDKRVNYFTATAREVTKKLAAKGG